MQATPMPQVMQIYQMPVGAPLSNGTQMVMMQQMPMPIAAAEQSMSHGESFQKVVQSQAQEGRLTQAWADIRDEDVLEPEIDTTHLAGRQLFGEALDPATLDKPSVAQSALPSKGSAPHGTGRCNPCAWFYKVKGCQNGFQCTYCHLCPDGELKRRKKAKVDALRSGAAAPASGGGALRLSALV